MEDPDSCILSKEGKKDKARRAGMGVVENTYCIPSASALTWPLSREPSARSQVTVVSVLHEMFLTGRQAAPALFLCLVEHSFSALGWVLFISAEHFPRKPCMGFKGNSGTLEGGCWQPGFGRANLGRAADLL